MIFSTFSGSENKMFRLRDLGVRCLVTALLLTAIGAAYPEDLGQIKDIRLVGLQRTDPGVIFSKIPIAVGDTFDEKSASETLKVLYELGYFSDVEITRDANVIVIAFRERPAIASIDFYGIKEFKEDQLRSALEKIGLKEGDILDAAVFDLATQELKSAYLAKGKYGVEISSTLTPLERNRVGISFDVFEGRTAKLENIIFFGNKSFSRDDLLERMSLSPRSRFLRGDEYSRIKLEADLENIRTYYLDQGFINVEILSSQVSLIPSKEEISVTINIDEGERFSFGDIVLAGDRVVPHEELVDFIDIKNGDLFSRNRINELTNKISERIGDEGYANANVRAIPSLDSAEKRVSFSIYIDAGRRVYVRRINISGNESTQDAVIRRELRQFEGEWYSLKRVQRSKQRLDLTGFFSSVVIKSIPVTGLVDTVDLNVEVVERRTGSFQIGIGYSTEDRAMLTASLNNDNIFGSGNSLALDISSGSVNQVFSVLYKNPYVNDYGLSRTLNVYNRATDYASLSVSTYTEDALGVLVDYGIPLSEYDKIFVGGGIEESKLTLGSNAASQYTEFVRVNGNDNRTVPLNVGWSRDRRDSAIIPSDGVYQRFQSSLATPVGDLEFYSLTYQIKSYYALGKFTTLVAGGQLAYAEDYGGDSLPFYKNYYAGGATTIRGYKSSTVGPKNDDGTALGAKRRVLTNVEVLTPIPGIKDDKSIRLSSFVDAGGLQNSFSDVLSDYRYSIGVGLNWYSPIGPMKLSFAKPLNDNSDDKTETFQFTLGGLF